MKKRTPTTRKTNPWKSKNTKLSELKDFKFTKVIGDEGYIESETDE